MYMHLNPFATIAPIAAAGKAALPVPVAVDGGNGFAPVCERFATARVPLANHRDAADRPRYLSFLSKRRIHTSSGDPQSPWNAPFDIFLPAIPRDAHSGDADRAIAWRFAIADPPFTPGVPPLANQRLRAPIRARYAAVRCSRPAGGVHQNRGIQFIGGGTA